MRMSSSKCHLKQLALRISMSSEKVSKFRGTFICFTRKEVNIFLTALLISHDVTFFCIIYSHVTSFLFFLNFPLRHHHRKKHTKMKEMKGNFLLSFAFLIVFEMLTFSFFVCNMISINFHNYIGRTLSRNENKKR